MGKYLRISLYQKGFDAMDGDWMKNSDAPSTDELLIEKLLYGKTVMAAELEHAIEAIAVVAGISPDQFWDEAIMPALANT